MLPSVERCEHPNGAEAVHVAHQLQDSGLDAVIVDGPCEWSPAHPDLKKFTKRYTRAEFVEA